MASSKPIGKCTFVKNFWVSQTLLQKIVWFVFVVSVCVCTLRQNVKLMLSALPTESKVTYELMKKLVCETGSLNGRYCIAHFVLSFVAMATRVGRGKTQLAAFDGPFLKSPQQMQKKSHRHLLHKPSYSQFCPKCRCRSNGDRLGENTIGSIRWPIPENTPIGAKISQKSFTQTEL